MQMGALSRMRDSTRRRWCFCAAAAAARLSDAGLVGGPRPQRQRQAGESVGLAAGDSRSLSQGARMRDIATCECS